MNVISTGIQRFDSLLGVGGIPRGGITEIFGPPSAGKTTLALHIVAQAQRLGLTCIYMDVEHSLSPHYAAQCGVDEGNLLLALPKSGNEALTMCHAMLQSRDIDLVVIDSVAALCSRNESIQPLNEGKYGDLFRLLSPFLRNIKGACRKTGGTLICTNQTRQRIKKGYGTPETTSGGLAIKFHADIRIELSIVEYNHKGGSQSGVIIQAKINKNRFGPRNQCINLEIMYNIGMLKERE